MIVYLLEKRGNMEQELLKLVCDYTSSSIMTAEEYIIRLVTLFTTSKSLQSYVYEVKFVHEDEIKKQNIPSEQIASYNYKKKSISIYYENLLQSRNKSIFSEENVNAFEYLMSKNLLLTEVLLCELEYANQHRMMLRESTIDAEVLKLSKAPYLICNFNALFFSSQIFSPFKSLITFSKKQKDNYLQNHFLSPEERLAQIKSHQELLEMFKKLGDVTSRLIKHEKFCVLENMLKGYIYNHGNLISPTMVYLKNNGIEPYLKAEGLFFEEPKALLKKLQSRYPL